MTMWSVLSTRSRWWWRSLSALLLMASANHAVWAASPLPIINQTPSIFDPHSGPAHLIYSLSLFTLEITAAIFLVVGGLLAYVVIRFHARDDDELSEPPQVYGSTQIELAWTVVPILIVVVLFLTAARIIFAVQDQPMPPSAVHVDVVGHQFWWEFRYPDSAFTTANELHIPVSLPSAQKTTFLKLLSADVDHSFWVPSLFGKTDSIPNRTNSMWFDPNTVGLYLGQCAQFCGASHAQMLLRVYVQTPKDFQAWLKQQQAPAVQDPAVATARQTFESQACVNCHTIRGTSAHGRFGPDLTHVMSRDTIASGIIPNTPANLKNWIQDPQTVKPGCLMPAMQLSSGQIDQIVAYLSTLK